MKSSSPQTGLRTVKFWARYDPKRHVLRDTAKFKWMLAEPSKESGEVIIQVKGHYVKRV